MSKVTSKDDLFCLEFVNQADTYECKEFPQCDFYSYYNWDFMISGVRLGLRFKNFIPLKECDGSSLQLVAVWVEKVFIDNHCLYIGIIAAYIFPFIYLDTESPLLDFPFQCRIISCSIPVTTFRRIKKKKVQIFTWHYKFNFQNKRSNIRK